MQQQTRCRLPGGGFDEQGRFFDEAELVALSGREEELLSDQGGASSAALVSTLLSRCVRRLGDQAPVSEAMARQLLVADRQYLLLKLRELSFGAEVRSSFTCPWPGCGERIDVTFPLAAIPVTPSQDKGPAYVLQLSEGAALDDGAGGLHREVAFRLPNGADQEALAHLVGRNEARALSLLLQRCLMRVGPFEAPGPGLVEALSPLARMEIERAMEQAAPRINLTMESTCPVCGHDYALPFDLQGFFFGELRINQELLYRETHYLAYHYHWSEHEIMSFTRAKRRRFIELLADEIERLNNER
ncbi:MAG: hypothetical protein HGA45_36285 [Chloroflexales bacterium]|nr:hypothetical protein [Chloroflexales bacterium]